MDKKHIFIALAVIAVILVSGCVGTQQKKAETPLSAKPFVGGTNGLVVSFFPGAPTDEVIQDKDASKRESVTFTTTVENKGETTVAPSKAKVRLTGINTGVQAWDIQGGNEQSITDQLDAVQKVGNSLVPGGQATVNFESQKGYRGTLEGQFQFKPVAEVCFNYESQGVATVCESENLLKAPTTAGACKPSGPKTVFNKGAPIQISSIEQVPFGKDKIGFQIKVKNVGGGKVFASSDISCTEKADHETADGTTTRLTVIDKVRLISVNLGGANIALNKCSPLGTYTPPTGTAASTIPLINGEGTILCRTDLDANRRGTVEDLLTVNLAYDYNSQTPPKTFTVRIAQ